MPTHKPRLALTLEPHQYELLKRLGALRGVPMSRVVSEMLEATEPVLQRVAVVLEAASKAQSQAKARWLESAEQAERELEPLMAHAMNQFDMFIDWAEDEARPKAKKADAAADRSGATRRPSPAGSVRPGRKSKKSGGSRESGKRKGANPRTCNTRGSGRTKAPTKKGGKGA